MSYKMEGARREGLLRIVLEKFEEAPLPVNMIYAQRKLMPLKLRTVSQLGGASPKRATIRGTAG
jgi:hypothetical protein